MKEFIPDRAGRGGFIAIATPESNAGVSNRHGVGIPGRFCGYPAYYPYSLLSVRPAYIRPVIYYSSFYGPYYAVARP